MSACSHFITITELSQLIKDTLEASPFLKNVTVKGEISNFKKYPSGHAYFTLKDGSSVISSVMWASYACDLDFVPKDGDEVIAHGRVTSYPARGSYQFSVDSLSLYGQGAELLKLKQLAEKLQKEGLFDESRKRPIPLFPSKIGVIAGKGSAGMKDILHNISLRWPLCTIYAFPSLVQGIEAPKDIMRAFEKAQSFDLDTLIIGRGGGSSEDLGAFNDEALVRAVAKSKCPVISAVGHEVDTTLIDLVADKRVSTPTGAAVAATPDVNDILMKLDDFSERFVNTIHSIITKKEQLFALLSNRSYFLNPGSIYQEKIDDIEDIRKRIELALRMSLDQKTLKVESNASRLKALDPKGVLKRGYSLTENKEGKIIKSKNDVQIGETLSTIFEDGIIESTVKGKHDGR